MQGAVADLDLVTGRRRQFAQHRVAMRHIDQGRQITRGGLVFARQAGGLDILCIGHAQRLGLEVHLRDECRQAAGVAAPQRVRGPVFAGHQGQMHQLATGQLGAHFEARTAAFFGVNVVLADGDDLVTRQLGFADHQTGHQFRQRSDGQHCAFVFAEQDFMGVLVHHQGHAGLQIQRIAAMAQAGDFTK